MRGPEAAGCTPRTRGRRADAACGGSGAGAALPTQHGHCPSLSLPPWSSLQRGARGRPPTPLDSDWSTRRPLSLLGPPREGLACPEGGALPPSAGDSLLTLGPRRGRRGVHPSTPGGGPEVPVKAATQLRARGSGNKTWLKPRQREGAVVLGEGCLADPGRTEEHHVTVRGKAALPSCHTCPHQNGSQAGPLPRPSEAAGRPQPTPTDPGNNAQCSG